MFALLAMKESDFKKLITLEPLDTGQAHLAAQPQPPHPAATFVARCSTLLSYMQPSATCVLPCGSLYNLLPPTCILLLPAYTPLRCLHAPLCYLYARRAAQVERAAQLTSKLIGINNRNLHTFDVTLDTTRNLARRVPEDRLIVAESGLYTPADLADLARYGARCFLIGESLMRQDDVEAATRTILANPRVAQGGL